MITSTRRTCTTTTGTGERGPLTTRPDDPSAGECGREVLLPPEAPTRRLVVTADKPVEVALTPPPKGELQFTCGMKMLSGTLVVDRDLSPAL